MLNSDLRTAGNGQDNHQQSDWLTTTLAAQPEAWALFLDIDGTLIDLAPSPDAIVVPTGLPQTLNAIADRLEGALALVTGRALAYADQLFQPYCFPIAGLHGCERRNAQRQVDRIIPTAEFEEMKASLAAAATQWPGVLIEDKGAAIAAHYRQAPQWRVQLTEAVEHHLLQAGQDFTLQRGKMVLEIRPVHANKGSALRAYLEEAPFRGRRPIAIGDDLTDEEMFRVANSFGGHSIRIADLPGSTEAHGIIPSAANLRDVLRKAANMGRSVT